MTTVATAWRSPNIGEIVLYSPHLLFAVACRVIEIVPVMTDHGYDVQEFVLESIGSSVNNYVTRDTSHIYKISEVERSIQMLLTDLMTMKRENDEK